MNIMNTIFVLLYCCSSVFHVHFVQCVTVCTCASILKGEEMCDMVVPNHIMILSSSIIGLSSMIEYQ